MAETLGSLCDKLTIVKLKQWHTDDHEKKISLDKQHRQLIQEINEYLALVMKGHIPIDRITFCSNKVYKIEGNEIGNISGSLGDVFSELSSVNYKLWKEQEKVYEFESVPKNLKNKVVKQLALLNLQRNQCIDEIDRKFQDMVIQSQNDD